MTDATEKTEQPEKAEENGAGKPGLFSRFYIAEWIAIAGVMVIAISFVWEWGYWSSFGISLAEIPMSVENLASSILVWVPELFLPVAALGMWAYLGFRTGSQVAEAKEAVEVLRQKNIKDWARVISINHIWIPRVLIMSSILAPLVLQYIAGKIYIIYIWSIVGLAVAFVISKKYNTKSAFVSFVVVFMCIYVYIQACASAFQDVENPAMIAQLHMDDDKIKEKSVIVLRNSADFVFAYDVDSEKLDIIPWRMIAFINYQTVPKDAVYKIPSLSNDDSEK